MGGRGLLMEVESSMLLVVLQPFWACSSIWTKVQGFPGRS